MREVGVEETVRMVLRALVLMNVQKRRLQERKREHEVHQHGNARLHTHIVPLAGRGILETEVHATLWARARLNLRVGR